MLGLGKIPNLELSLKESEIVMNNETNDVQGGEVEVKATKKAVKKVVKPAPKEAPKATKKAPPAKKAKAAEEKGPNAAERRMMVLKAVKVVGLKGREAVAEKAGLTEDQVKLAMVVLRSGEKPLVKRTKHEDGSLEFVLTAAGVKALASGVIE